MNITVLFRITKIWKQSKCLSTEEWIKKVLCLQVYTHTHTHTHMSCAQSINHVQLFAIPWTIAHQAVLSMGFSRQEYYSGLPCPPPGDLPNPGIKPASLKSLGSLPLAPPGKPCAITLVPPLKKKKKSYISALILPLKQNTFKNHQQY